jgi:hypothetical protein
MATKSMAYDNAAYEAVLLATLGSVTGSAGVTQRFSAAVQCLLKSVQASVVTAGTSNDIQSIITLSGTTTTTTAFQTLGSGATATKNVTTTLTLAQGDSAWLVKGTDATAVLAVGAELVLVPGATVSA